jgi:hypothetical protein
MGFRHPMICLAGVLFLAAGVAKAQANVSPQPGQVRHKSSSQQLPQPMQLPNTVSAPHLRSPTSLIIVWFRASVSEDSSDLPLGRELDRPEIRLMSGGKSPEGSQNDTRLGSLEMSLVKPSASCWKPRLRKIPVTFHPRTKARSYEC